MNEEKINKRFEAIEKRLDIIEGKTKEVHKKQKIDNSLGYRQDSTAHKIIILKEEGYFDKPKSISEIIGELKSKDYHLKASDLTLPLRKIVRKNLLARTRKNADRSESKNWMYVKK